MAITLADANRMVEAALAKAAEIDVKVSIAVCDSGGSLIAFGRMDGATGQRRGMPGQGRGLGSVWPGQRDVAGRLSRDTSRHCRDGRQDASRTGRCSGGPGWRRGWGHRRQRRDCGARRRVRAGGPGRSVTYTLSRPRVPAARRQLALR